MKKYILKKDLPLAKAGTIVTLESDNEFGLITSKSQGEMYAHIAMSDINEWLEEIIEKPKRSVWNLLK